MTAGRVKVLQWSLLLLATLLCSAVLSAIGSAAPLLLGALLAAIVMAAAGRQLSLQPRLFPVAQALLGCLIASTVTYDVVMLILAHWWEFIAITLATLAVSGMLGAVLARAGVVPGSAAVWGLTPGAATAMVLMAEAYGADARLVAVMSYTRAVCVTFLASALIAFHFSASPMPPDVIAPLRMAGLSETIGVGLVGGAIGLKLRLPAGAMLGPLLLGATLNALGLFDYQMPKLAMMCCYLLIGWRIGLSFTPEVVVKALRALSGILLATAVLIAFCGLLAIGLMAVMKVDGMTAYLATSPGGIDSIAVIAASAPVNVPIVMSFQIARVIAVLLLGPAMARISLRAFERRSTNGDELKPERVGKSGSRRVEDERK